VNQARWSFLGAILALTAAFAILAYGQGRGDRRDEADRQVTLLARTVAVVTRQREIREDEAAAELPQSFVAKLGDQVDRVVVVKNTKVLASNKPEEAGRSLDQESLSDKILYDHGSKLKSLVAKNLEERERNQDRPGNAFPEVELSSEGDRVVATVPATQGDRYLAAARVEARPTPLRVGFPYLIFGVALLAFGVFFAASKVLPGGATVVVGAVLVVGSTAADLYALSAWRAEHRTQGATQRAQSILRLAPLVLPELAPSEKSAWAAAMDQDPLGVPKLELAAVRSATVGAAAIEGGIVHRGGSYEVVYASDYYRGAEAKDQKNLLKWSLGFVAVGLGLFLLGFWGHLYRFGRSFWSHRAAYGYMFPAMVGMAVLVFIPVVYGIVLGFTERRYNVIEFAGISNFITILSDFSWEDGKSFYYKFAVTVLWTVTNVVLHKGLYRVLLVVPWAVPNYITALIWKGMFNKQYGLINEVLGGLGIEPVGWFSTFWKAFAANLTTNTWLGFPFMMVVALGALQSIPRTCSRPPKVDGASRWDRFRHITLPLLKPALFPAVILGSIWTFNMFNIIYLVSGGQPEGATDILITEAYRQAFERDRYGYAAAYSVLIFLILSLVYSLATQRASKASEEVHG
jgi:ABC-type sugar transport system permease subunit